MPMISARPNRKLSRIALVSVSASAVLFMSQSAWAEQDPKCLPAFEQAQELRKKGKFLAASEALITCSQPTCPAFIATECTAWYGEVQASQPSVAFEATEGGRPLIDVRVSVDGVLVSERSDGRAVAIDPGPHEFKFEANGKSVVVKALIIEGEKNRTVSAAFAASASDAGTLTLPPAGDMAKTDSSGRRPPVAAYVVGGLGVLALGGGLALRLIGSSEYDDLDKSCHTSCPDSDVDRVKLKYTLSKVAFGVGGAALVTAGILFVVNRSAKPVQTGFLVVPEVSSSGAGALLVSRF